MVTRDEDKREYNMCGRHQEFFLQRPAGAVDAGSKSKAEIVVVLEGISRALAKAQACAPCSAPIGSKTPCPR